jgi:hypothetical protein
MGYVDKQIAAAQKTIADAVAGKGLQKAIRALQEKSQIKDSLKDLPARGAITAKRSKGIRAAAGASMSFTELSRSLHITRRELRSTDGLLVLEYYNVKQTVMDRATFNWLDYDPNA